MLKAKDIMNANVITVDPEDTVDSVMEQMVQRCVSGLPVVDMSGQLVGIVTEFDLLDLVWEADTGKNKAYHYMSRDVRTVDEDDDFNDVAAVFRMLSVRRLLVMRGEQVAGIISRRDLIRHTLELRSTAATSAGAAQ